MKSPGEEALDDILDIARRALAEAAKRPSIAKELTLEAEIVYEAVEEVALRKYGKHMPSFEDWQRNQAEAA